MAFIYVQNPSGAVFSGDQLELRIAARNGAKLHVTSTSATKLHRMLDGSAFQKVQLEAKQGSYIEYLPDQLIPQAQSSYNQETTINLDRGSMLIASEIIAPGRLARGEIFAFSRLKLETQIRLDGSTLFTDRIVLEPTTTPINIRGVLGSFLYSGNLLALIPGGNAKGVYDAASSLDMTGEDFRLGVGALPGAVGIIVRVLARSSSTITRLMEDAWSRIRMQMIGAPAPSKRK
ncbi:urease accessory protein [Mesorhizobium australicum]|uniref:Urease accessory protein UreD n=2 Tax=Mesorhizobium australicum TaxID=536018 RepID=A0A1X7MR06_9HYPH|nr:urease accessory protein [Mesorhizobium australicum]